MRRLRGDDDVARSDLLATGVHHEVGAFGPDAVDSAAGPRPVAELFAQRRRQPARPAAQVARDQ
jgi:hypothetical protein